MSRTRLTLAGLAAAVTLALGAAAGEAAAAGPYEPFPESPKERSHKTLEKLNDRLLPAQGTIDAEDLEEGVYLEEGEVLSARASKGRARRRQPVAPTAAAPVSQRTAAGLLRRAGLERPSDQPVPGGLWLLAAAIALALAAVVAELRVVRPRES